MNLTDKQRDTVEHALDSMALRLRELGALDIDLDLLYEKACSIVRDLPPNVRRQRSDRLQRRSGPQATLKAGAENFDAPPR